MTIDRSREPASCQRNSLRASILRLHVREKIMTLHHSNSRAVSTTSTAWLVQVNQFRTCPIPVQLFFYCTHRVPPLPLATAPEFLSHSFDGPSPPSHIRRARLPSLALTPLRRRVT